MLSILLIAAALCYTFGQMVGDTRQGWAVLAAMLVIFVPLLFLGYWAEQSGNPRLAALGVDQVASDRQPGGNMEGKEVRFGIAQSAIWAAATTAASNGSVNSMHDSYTPLGGLVPMWLMQLGEVVFGGVGSGLYGMLVFAIIAVFVAGLMVGRTPEYLGKKIEAFEMKMAALVILIPPMVVLVGTAVAVATRLGHRRASLNTGGPHGFSEILYAFSSAGNNNGSAFAGLNANTPFYNIALGDSDARGPLLAGDSHVGDCRFVGPKEGHARQRRHVADAHAAVCDSAGWRGDFGRCVDVRSGLGLGADRGTLDDGRWMRRWQLKQKPIRCSIRAIVGRAVVDSFVKLDPRRQVRNPVMFTVYIGSILTTGLFVLSLRYGGEEPPWFICAISAWLWFTVLFANFAEAMAEGRGKAQADALRRARHEVPARKFVAPPTGPLQEPVFDAMLHHGDLADGSGVRSSARRRRVCRGGRLYPSGRRNHRRRCLGGRKRHHGRKRPGDPRKRRRPQQRDRRHAGLVRLARRASHRRPRRDLSWIA